MKKIASLSAIEYDLGKSQPIDTLDFLKNDQDKLNIYKKAGSNYFAASEISNIDLCFNAIEKTLNATSVKKDAIDVVLYVSENATRGYSINIIDVNKLLLKAGLNKALPIGISLSDCANIITGLQVGVSMIASGMANNVLLVCSDMITGEDEKRKVERDTSIFSDGAVSCILSKPGNGDFDICSLINENLPSLWAMNSEAHKHEYSMEKFKTIHRISRAILKENMLTTANIKKVFTSNYSLPTNKLFVKMTGCKADKGFYDNIGRFGHTLAGDILINLKNFYEDNTINSGDAFLSLVDSHSTCGAIVFCKN
ncbi:hypothetical protein IMCC3317_08150 [Kordia antarctica]|uniref:Beta-ketoacyl-[acyl-carrier-protein] synthase III N-terminal domain-containing protein n=1 Tax=Kordia antarctica TaxID=1218801 RepID=A0A7L4ZGB0_9FLAO|nr:hypothetical protein [Kordia antarctica]QHI35469.1 hypothetical protein IMCC3317_08150 [Kordia antarctica]